MAIKRQYVPKITDIATLKHKQFRALRAKKQMRV